MTNFSGGRTQTVTGGNDALFVPENDKTTDVAGSWEIKTGKGYKLADDEATKVELVGKKILIEAPTEVRLKCGDTTLVLSPDSVTIETKTVTITGATSLKVDGNGNTIELAAAGATLTSATEVVIVGPSGVKLNS